MKPSLPTLFLFLLLVLALLDRSSWWLRLAVAASLVVCVVSDASTARRAGR